MDATPITPADPTTLPPTSHSAPSSPATPPTSLTPAHIPFTPSFSHDIHTWLAHAEATWDGRLLGDEDKYQAVIRALPTDVYARIIPSITNAARGTRYLELKAALIAALGRTTRQHLLALEGVQPEGRRPSELLRHMQGLNAAAGNPLSDTLLRMRHTKLMPHGVQMHLLSCPTLSMSEHGELADTLTEAMCEQLPSTSLPPAGPYQTPTATINALPNPPSTMPTTTPAPTLPPNVSPPPPTQKAQAMMARLQDLASDMRTLLQPQLHQPLQPQLHQPLQPQLHQPLQPQLHQPLQPQLHQPLQQPLQLQQPPWYTTQPLQPWVQPTRERGQQQRWQPPSALSSHQACYYHQKFGTAARNCQQPCAWRNDNSVPTNGRQQGNY